MKKILFPLFGRFSKIEVITAAAILAMTVSTLFAFSDAMQRQAEKAAAEKQADSTDAIALAKQSAATLKDDLNAINQMITLLPVR